MENEPDMIADMIDEKMAIIDKEFTLLTENLHI